MSDFDDHLLTSNPVDDHETGNVRDKLRPAAEVWWTAWKAWDDSPTCADDEAIAIIEADRQAVRTALVAEIAAWLRKEAPAALCDPRMVGNAIEAKWGK